MTLYTVILAGGSGTRLWPLSREQHPKQFLSLMGGATMLQETVSRLDGLDDAEPPIVVCNEEHRFLVTDQMRQVGKTVSRVIVEPAGRNTAPALTLAALSLEAGGEDPTMIVMPADHVIADASAFHDAVRSGVPHAEAGYLVTFGVVPSGPKTGYGYIRKGAVLRQGEKPIGAFEAAAFEEKPDLETAEAYVAAGDYLWNSGIFMMRRSVWLAELARYRPDIAEACRKAFLRGRIDGGFFRPDKDIFEKSPRESIDYAVMEKAVGARPEGDDAIGSKGCVVVPLDAEWSDIGSWSSLWEEREGDDSGNVIQGDVLARGTKDALLIGQSRLLAAVGVENLVVVETGDAVLVADKDRVQEVREIVDLLKSEHRTEADVHRKVGRPWGTYEVIDGGPGFQVKRLTIDVGGAVSLQKHRHRSEHWVVVKGTAKVTRGDEESTLAQNESTFVPAGMVHRIENGGDGPLEIIEVQTGDYLGEDDIIRYKDNYNRRTG